MMFKYNAAYNKLRKSYSKNLPEYLAIRNRQYPEFVFEQRPKALKNEIPVFTLHSVEPTTFEAKLQFLSRNGYQTLNADHFYECLIGSRPFPERAVVLTFDDGWGTLWAIAYPLLKKYGFHAVSFLIPGLIRDGDFHRPSLDDVLNGKATLEEITGGIPGHEPLCTWHEIREMHESGAVDFQSHTMYHSLIFTSPVIEDFFHPAFDAYPKNFNVPVFENNGIDQVSREADLGMPIYENEPRFGEKNRYFDDIDLRNQCIEYVRDNGGPVFFEKHNWRDKLGRVIDRYRQRHGETGRFESDADRRRSIYEDLLASKATIEKHLPGKTVNHLCYPWWVGSSLSVEMSKEAGYRTNFWGVVGERRTTNRVGDDPFRVARLLGDEYIFRLPGEGRKPLVKIVEEKFSRSYMGFLKRLLGRNLSITH